MIRAWLAFVVSFVTGAVCAEHLGSQTIPFLWGVYAGVTGAAMGLNYVVAAACLPQLSQIWTCYSATLLGTFVLLDGATIFFPPPEAQDLQHNLIGVCLLAGVLSWVVLFRKPSWWFVALLSGLGIIWLALYTVFDPAMLQSFAAYLPQISA